jgi:hypothetical protein
MSVERQKKRPDWENSDRWTEYSWEEALKYHDDVAGRYFQLMERFGDLPDAEDLIAARLGQDDVLEFDDGDYTTFEGDSGWEDELVDLDDEDDDSPIRPGDMMYFETATVYKIARRLSLGWCNIMASVLGPGERFWGMGILFHLGRVLRYVALSIGDGTFDRLNASIAFGKRAHWEINYVIGAINAMSAEKPRYANSLDCIRDHLLKCEQSLVDYLLDCRTRRENGGLKPDH